MTIPQYILIVISLFFIGERFFRLIRKEKFQTGFKFMVTLVVWGTVLLISVNPTRVRVFSESLGFGENLNTLIFLGFVIVFILIFRIIAMIESVEREITELVRKEALKDLKSAKSSSI